MLGPKALRRADLISGTLISGVGILVLIMASRMPMGGTYGGVDNPWYASPAALPLLLGGLFGLLGIGVFYRGWQAGGAVGFWRVCSGLVYDRAVWRRFFVLGALWGGMVVYAMLLAWKPFGGAAGLFGRVFSPQGSLGFLAEGAGANYWIASAIFLVGFGWAFRGVSDLRLRRRGWVVLTLGLVLAPLFLGYLFSVHLQVPLP